MKFKINDRVAVYNHRGRILGRVDSITNGFLDVSAGSGHAFSPHPKQCRLLKKKERRRIRMSDAYLLTSSFLSGVRTFCLPNEPGHSSWIEFVEVKKK